MNENIAISVKNVTKSYRLYDNHADRVKETFHPFRKKYHHPFNALTNISFDVRKGETLGIIGQNGSGKSTLLQIICGILQPTSGSVEVNGRVSALLELGAGFNPEFTGRQNVYINAGILGLTHKDIEARFDDIAAFADIGNFIDQPVKTYSSGMYVRLAFSVVAHVYADILIIDEALAVGDFMFQQKCNSFIKNDLRDTTKLLVTHDMSAISNMADSVLLMHKGKLNYVGPPQEAIDRYQILARACDTQTQEPPYNLSQTDSSHYKDTSSIHDNRLDWSEIDTDKLSGSLQAQISRFTWQIDNKKNGKTIKNGKLLKIDFEIICSESIMDAIIGYQVQDRFGTVIFGENSQSSLGESYTLNKGKNFVSLSIQWPQVASAKYSLTLGIGAGHDSVNHTIDCWAHNIIVLQSNPSGPEHGIFNNNIYCMSLRYNGRP